MPLMLLLFVLFPRIPGPLWGIPQDAHSAITGIDNTMRMGSISNLALSEQIAFRVKFEGEIPSQSDRYWRGPVLWNFDGATWTEFDNKNMMATAPILKMTGDAFNYTTTIEPNDNNWLFALDFPLNPDANLASYLQYDGQLKTVKPLSQRQQITLTSYPNYRFNAEDDTLKNVALELPFNKHPKTRQLALSWVEMTSSPSDIVTLALNYFNQQDFVYTLQPPLLSDDKIDAFLFDTKEGFCEHFAASFTVLMRAAGIPARVVTGYQGGELNPVDGYLTIRQYDAHAWSEVWIAGQGWLRIDPTSAVSRQRIDQGMTQTMPNTFNQPPAFIPRNKQIESLWRSIKNNLNAVDNAWNQWVLDYGPSAQKSLLKKLGMTSPNWQTMVLWLIMGFFIVSALISLYLLYNRPDQTPASKLYNQFCQKAARMGCIRKPSQGPLDFARSLTQHVPAQSTAINHITQIYIDLHYGKQQHSLSELKYAIKQFK
jgi:transglutaminase-like putative cysteine protease